MGVSATHLDGFLFLVMIIQEVPEGRAELLVVPLYLHDGGLDALQQLVLLQKDDKVVLSKEGQAADSHKTIWGAARCSHT